MKLTINLHPLLSNVEKMQAQATYMDGLTSMWNDEPLFFDDKLSSTGIEIKLEDLDFQEGLLSYKGRQILLYISDHGPGVGTALKDGSEGNKFHVADCNTLNSMKAQKRYERYIATNNLSGNFEIFGTDENRTNKQGITRLNVCKNCLKFLNYKKARLLKKNARNNIVKHFDIEDFFLTHSSFFKHPPKLTHKTSGYTDDWEKTSLKIRKESNFQCQNCQLDLSAHQHLMHVHHINGVKNDNSRTNLICLCADCHRKEPYHNTMFVSQKDMKMIHQLRCDQKLINSHKTWEEIFKYTDPGLHGLLYLYQEKNWLPPTLNYNITDNNTKKSLKLEFAWPQRKYGIYKTCNMLGKNPPRASGWELLNIDQALKN